MWYFLFWTSGHTGENEVTHLILHKGSGTDGQLPKVYASGPHLTTHPQVNIISQRRLSPNRANLESPSQSRRSCYSKHLVRAHRNTKHERRFFVFPLKSIRSHMTRAKRDLMTHDFLKLSPLSETSQCEMIWIQDALGSLETHSSL